MKPTTLIMTAVSVVLIGAIGYTIYTQADSQTAKTGITPQAASAPQNSESPITNNSSSDMAPPKMQIDSAKKYTATLTTDKGDIVISLNAAKTPVTVNNFVALARKKFYNNTVFHRVIKGFMIQGGDPEGTGRGGPGYRFNDEPFEGEYVRGTVAMANAGPNTNGSQFFIMHKDVPLPKNYVIFGTVTAGMDVVDQIAESKVTDSGSGEASTPVVPVKVTSVTVSEQ